MKRTAAALFFAVALASAQKLELGATAGFGYTGAEDVSFRPFANIGVQVCGFCSATLALFGEYSHGERVGNKLPARITSSDLLGGGLRIQAGRRIRPFFDVGVAGGWDRFVYTGGGGRHNMIGLVAGGGVSIPLRGRWYIRPQYRLYLLSGLHVVSGGSMGIGFRF
jgi:hypothetical protein